MGTGRVSQILDKGLQTAPDDPFPGIGIVGGAVHGVGVEHVPFMRGGEYDGIFPMVGDVKVGWPDPAQLVLIDPVRVEFGNAHQGGAEGMGDFFYQPGRMVGGLEG